MWNKLAKIFQDLSYRRLGIALLVSIILHIVIFGRFDIKLPFFIDETPPIEARIQIAKAVIPALEKKMQKAASSKPNPKLKPVKQYQPIETPKAAEVLEPEKTIVAPLEPTPITEIVAQDLATPQIAENIEPPSVVATTDVEPNLNVNAYQYLETDFEVRTEIDGTVQGSATIKYNMFASRYQLSWLTKGKGIAALLFPELLQNSEGDLTKTGLQPKRYTYQFGNDFNKKRTVNFDWQEKKVTSLTSKGSTVEDLPEGTQDLLSFMYQFMHVAPLQQMQINIATGKKLSTYDYSFEGEETVLSGLGEIKTIHIVHVGNDAEERTELWLALDYQYIPVKIRKIEKNGKLVEMLVSHISTSKPNVEQ